MPVARKRPCCVCHRWFRPDNRVGSRQHACSKPECQAMRRRKQQAAWRARHPDYFAGRRIQARMVLEDRPGPLRLHPPLNQLPWDIAQSEFGTQGADFLGVMGGLDRIWCRVELSRGCVPCVWNSINLSGAWSIFACAGLNGSGGCWRRWRPAVSRRRSWWLRPSSLINIW